MCIAILNKRGTLSKETLTTCFNNNPDGAGLSWIDNKNTIHTYKTLDDIKTYIETYQKIRKSNSKPILLHFRIATTGSICIDNTHPFHINKNSVLAHNGIISIKIPKNTDISDTRAFNDLIMKHIDINTEHINLLVSKFIGSSKLIILNADSTYTLINESLGQWDKDNWYSNDSYKPTKKVLSTPSVNNYRDYYYKDNYTDYKDTYRPAKQSICNRLEDITNELYAVYSDAISECSDEISEQIYEVYSAVDSITYQVECSYSAPF